MKRTNVFKWSICSLALIAGSTTSFAQQDAENIAKEQKTEVMIINDDYNTFRLEGVELKGDKLFMDKISVSKNTVHTAAEKEERPFIGVGIEAIESGIKITEIYDYSAAAAAGLLSNDIITSVDGQNTTSIKALQDMVAKHKVGDQIEITYLRNGQTASTLAKLKGHKQRKRLEREFKHPLPPSQSKGKTYDRENNYKHFYAHKKEEFDACKELEKLSSTPFIGVYIHVDAENNGVDVVSTIDGTDAPNSALQAGDQIIQINRQKVSDFESLRAALDQFEVGDRVDIKYARNGKVDKTPLTLSSMGERYPYKVMKLEKACAAQQSVDEVRAKENIEETALPLSKGPALDIFPNPAEDIVNLSFEGGIKAKTTILVLDIQGKEVMRKQVNENPEQFNMQLDLSKLTRGAYIISVMQADQLISKQISLK